jgi:hypothetical protein
LSFADTNPGRIASPLRLAATINGGKSWDELSFPKELKDTYRKSKTIFPPEQKSLIIRFQPLPV